MAQNCMVFLIRRELTRHVILWSQVFDYYEILNLDLDNFTAQIASDVAVDVQSLACIAKLCTFLLKRWDILGSFFASGGNLFHWGIVRG